MMKNFVFFIFMFLLFSCQNEQIENSGETINNLVKEWQNPPVDARPRGLWTWVNGNYDSAEIWREIRAVKAKGMGGLDIWDAPTVQDPKGIVPVGPDQVSDAFMRGVKIAMEAASETGIELGYIWNQSVSYLDPEHSHMALYLTSAFINEPGQQHINLPFPHIKPHKKFGYKVLQRDQNLRPLHWDNVAVMAYPVQASDTSLILMDQMIDLTHQMQGDQLSWEVPPGKWNILRFVWSRTTANGLTPTPATLKPALDFLNPEATEIHLSYLLDLIEKHTGSLEGSPMKYFCADSYEFKGLWTPKMPQMFEDSLGYSLIKYLPALEGYTINDQETTERFVFDFNNLRSELVIAHHYAKAKEVCNRYGIGFTSEAAGPGPPVHMDVPMESIKSSGALSWPRGEFWVSDDPAKRDRLQIIKGIASAAHQYDQPYVTAEAFTGVDLWAKGPGDLKQYGDRAFAEGLNRIDFHTFSHTPREAGKPGWIYSFATIISENLIWWPKSEGFMSYLGRCSYMLQQGHFVADALYYHGEEAPFFAKPKHVKPDLGLGYDYDITNADIILNKLSVKDGKLILPHGQQYSVLVLPDKNRMTMPVLEKLQQLLKDGATIIGPKPVRSHGLANAQDEAVSELANEIWGDLDGQQQTEKQVGEGTLVWGKTSREVLQSMGIIPDITFATISQQDSLDFIHRKAEDVDFYFIRNPYDKPVAALVNMRIAGKRPEIWNPVTGQMKPLSIYRTGEENTSIPLSLEPHGSVFIVFAIDGKQNATISRDGESLFPVVHPPQTWAFSDEGGGNIRLSKAGNYTLTVNGNTFSKEAVVAVVMDLAQPEWPITFTDPWQETFTATTNELKSWTEFDQHRIRYFSGQGTYENAFEIPAELLDDNRQVILQLGRVEEVAEVYVNGESAGLVWNNPGKVDITHLILPGNNTLQVEVVNRWPNRMIGDYKLPESERKVRSSIVTLPTAWNAPLEQLPNQTYQLQESGLLGPVSLKVYDILQLDQVF
ncbi:MAG: glycosyl hydrolase [Candidatus Cyclobacteriaceae bacterium M3_2C_046]